MEEKFLQLFKESLEIQGDVKLSDKFRDYAEWDSLSRLSLIALLDTEYGVQIENKQFDELSTVQDIVQYVKKSMK